MGTARVPAARQLTQPASRRPEAGSAREDGQEPDFKGFGPRRGRRAVIPWAISAKVAPIPPETKNISRRSGSRPIVARRLLGALDPGPSALVAAHVVAVPRLQATT